jgi:two-component system chemotaxis sensor kinase CheA
VVKALEAAHLAKALPARLDEEAAELLSELRTADLSAEALRRLGELLGDAQAPAKKAAPVADLSGAASSRRDAETVELIGDFLEESSEGLSRADEILLAIEKGEADHEKINALFRVFHTIKGVAGFLELSEIVSLAHTTETLLNLVREGKATLDGDAFDVTFESTALLRQMLEALRRAVDTQSDLESQPGVGGLVTRIQEVIDGTPAEEEQAKPAFEVKRGPADAQGKPLYVVRKPSAAPEGADATPAPTPTATPKPKVRATATPTPTPAPTPTPEPTPEPTPQIVFSGAFETRRAAEFHVDPEDALVTVDGSPIGVADDWDDVGGGKQYVFPGPGEYLVQLSLAGYRTAWIKIVVSPGAKRDVANVDTNLDEIDN